MEWQLSEMLKNSPLNFLVGENNVFAVSDTLDK